MKIESVASPAFAPYGKVLEGYDTKALLETLASATPLPEGVEYVSSFPALEVLNIAKQIEANAYGGMPVQLEIGRAHV